jgi:hypothetical protein
MEPLVRGTTDEIQTFFAFVVGKGLRAQRLPVKVGKETTVGKNDKRALPDRCERRKSFCAKANIGVRPAIRSGKRRTRTNHNRRRIGEKSETRNLRKEVACSKDP